MEARLEYCRSRVLQIVDIDRGFLKLERSMRVYTDATGSPSAGPSSRGATSMKNKLNDNALSTRANNESAFDQDISEDRDYVPSILNESKRPLMITTAASDSNVMDIERGLSHSSSITSQQLLDQARSQSQASMQLESLSNDDISQYFNQVPKTPGPLRLPPIVHETQDPEPEE